MTLIELLLLLTLQLIQSLHTLISLAVVTGVRKLDLLVWDRCFELLLLLLILKHLNLLIIVLVELSVVLEVIVH